MDVILYQMDVEYGQPEANFNKVQAVLKDLQPRPGTLLVVPELFLTGYHPGSIDEVGEPLERGVYIQRLKELVHDHDILFYGSIAARFEGKMYNTGVLLSADGIEASYKKTHLFGPMGEKELFHPGREVVTTSLGEYIVGLSICYDLRFPGLYQAQANADVNLSLICAEWPIARVDHWRSLCKARAIEHQQYVVAVNRVGRDPEYVYGGHSAIFSPFGELKAGLNNAEEGIVEVELQLDEINNFRNKFDVREDRWI